MANPFKQCSFDSLERRYLCSAAEEVRSLSKSLANDIDYKVKATVGNRLFFGVSVPKSDSDELWTTDGTRKGTYRVGTSYSELPLVAGKTVVFFESGKTGVQQVWRSDGTVHGTYALTDLPAKDGSQILGALSDTVIFSVQRGVAGEVDAVSADDPERYRLLDAQANQVFAVGVVGSKLIYDNETSARPGLYCTDGKGSASTVLVSTVAPAVGLNNSNALVDSIDYRGDLFFPAYAKSGATELWKTNGTRDGTVAVQRLASNSAAGSQPRGFVEDNGLLYFISAGHHNDIYRTSGASVKAVTHLKPGQPGYDDEGAFIDTSGLTAFGGSLYLHSSEMYGEDVVSRIDKDGTTTRAFNGLVSDDEIVFDGGLFLHGFPTADPRSKDFLYRSDADGVSKVVPQPDATLLGATGTSLYFATDTEKEGLTLYRIE